jgi:hypothetical protein
MFVSSLIIAAALLFFLVVFYQYANLKPSQLNQK